MDLNEFVINNLERIRDSQKTPSDDVISNLDKLYEQRIDLIDAAIRKSTDEYVKATNGMNQAAKKTKEAIDDLAKLEEAIKKVADAIGLVTELLSKVV